MTGEIRPARCNSHLCPSCSPLHQLVARTAIEQGLRRRIREHRRETVIFLTLTEPARAELDLPAFRGRWQATAQALRRMWGMGDYALVVEFQKRGALHPHVFLEVDDQVADDLRDRRSRESYGRRLQELGPRMQRLGWGQMVDAVTIAAADDTHYSRYAAKSLAGYATKQAKARFKEAGARHVRPLRLSYGWVDGGLAGIRESVIASERMTATKIEGTWERIPKPRAC